jgi:hypothetical protein
VNVELDTQRAYIDARGDPGSGSNGTSLVRHRQHHVQALQGDGTMNYSMSLGRWALLLGAAAALLAAHAARAEAPETGIPPVEARRIERLIDVVARSTDRRFIRNGTDYDAGTAARFLRAKWEYASRRIHTAEDFVREVGTQSSSTGTRYRVRGPDGREEDGASFLNRELAHPAAPAPG